MILNSTYLRELTENVGSLFFVKGFGPFKLLTDIFLS